MKQLKTDVVVISAGTAGLAASIAAAENGAEVIAFEKAAGTGGTGNMANGLFAVESRLQKLKQLTLSREQAFKLHMDFTHWKVNARLVKTYIDKSASTIDWLEKMGIEFEDVGSHGIGNNHTWHIVKSLTGSGQGVLLMKTMAERAKQLGVRIFLKTPVKKILKTGGRVTGVIAEDEKGETIQVDAKAVISAAGGWGGDYPDLPTVSGDGINMAREAGAHVTEKRYPVVRRKPMPPPRKGGGGSFGPTMMTVAEAFEQPNLMVNLMGERFTNEEIMAPNLFWRNVLFMQKDRCGFMIFDEDTKNYYVKNGYDIIAGFTIGNMKPVFLPTEFDKCMNEITESGSDILFVFDSLEEMASKLEINPDRLRATVTEYNHFCETGIDGAFNKNPRYLRPVKNPKFYVRKSMAQSPTGDWEGIRINHKTEVIAEDFTVIPGFYAAGTDAACNVFHGTYPNILPGNNMGFAINSGRIAGENAAAYSKSLDSKK